MPLRFTTPTFQHRILMTKFTVREGTCKHCNTTQSALLHLKVMQSGAESFVWVCVGCDRLAPFGGDLWIAADKVYERLTRNQIQSLPLLMDRPTSRCAKCNSRGVENHHWAPKAIFGDDAENWPQDYLCKPCHDLWHSKMSGAMLSKLNQQS